MHQNEYLWSKGLTVSYTTQFRLDPIESVCKQYDTSSVYMPVLAQLIKTKLTLH